MTQKKEERPEHKKKKMKELYKNNPTPSEKAM